MNTNLKETGIWESALNKTPDASGMIADCTPKKTLTVNQKCFNCDGPHHLTLCPKDQDPSHEKNCEAHNVDCCLSCSPMDPKRCPPEPSENNKHNIDCVCYTRNTVTKRWDKDANPGTCASYHLTTAPCAVLPPTQQPAWTPPTTGQSTLPAQPGPSPTGKK